MFIGIVTPGSVVSVSLPEKDVIESFSSSLRLIPNGALVRSKRKPVALGLTFMTSLAVPLVIRTSSTPASPLLSSVPSPLFQIITSLPLPPLTTSLPRKPVTRSLPSPASIASTLSPPTMMSSPASPLIDGVGEVDAGEVDRVVAVAGVDA